MGETAKGQAVFGFRSTKVVEKGKCYWRRIFATLICNYTHFRLHIESGCFSYILSGKTAQIFNLPPKNQFLQIVTKTERNQAAYKYISQKQKHNFYKVSNLGYWLHKNPIYYIFSIILCVLCGLYREKVQKTL